MVVASFWMEAPSVARLRRMADEVKVLVPKPGLVLVTGPRAGTETCQLLLVEVDLMGAATEEAAKGSGSREQAAQGVGERENKKVEDDLRWNKGRGRSWAVRTAWESTRQSCWA